FSPCTTLFRSSHSGVGGTYHRTPGFHGAHTRDLQMLAQRPRVTEPAQVAEVYENTCSRPVLVAVPDRGDDLFAKYVFIADVGCNDLPAYLEQGLSQRAAVEIAQWYVHGIHKPPETRRHEFAEGNQMLLVVAHARIRAYKVFKRCCRIETDRAVGVAVFTLHSVMQGCPHKNARFPNLRDILPPLPDLWRDV